MEPGKRRRSNYSALCYGMENQETVFRFPAAVRDFVFQIFQAGSGFLSAPCVMGTEDSLLS